MPPWAVLIINFKLLMSKKIVSIFSSLVLMSALVITNASYAAPPGDPSGSDLQVVPFEFVAEGENCDVEAGWVPEATTTDNSILFLKKGCPTPTIAAAGADVITPLEGGPVSALTELNFDYRTDGHCGAGAPRFNVQVDGTIYFLGCTQGTHTLLDPVGTTTGTSTATTTATTTGWVHVEFGPADFAAAGIPITGTTTSTTTGILEDIEIIFDEGTDVGPGFVYLDNISVNGDEVGDEPILTSKDQCKNGGYLLFGFRNQGQCVSSVVSNRGGNR